MNRNTRYSELSSNSIEVLSSPVVQQQLSFAGIGLLTVVAMTAFIREVRLLIEACGKLR